MHIPDQVIESRGDVYARGYRSKDTRRGRLCSQIPDEYLCPPVFEERVARADIRQMGHRDTGTSYRRNYVTAIFRAR